MSAYDAMVESLVGMCKLSNVLALCVRRRPCSEVPDAIRWAVTLPGCWGEGYPTREAACEAILARASEVAK